jgi:molybdopterin synthase sulfur carrier subunit
MITVLYFARLKESLGIASEQIALPQAVSDLEGLRALLVARGGVWYSCGCESKHGVRRYRDRGW